MTNGGSHFHQNQKDGTSIDGTKIAFKCKQTYDRPRGAKKVYVNAFISPS